MAEICTKHTAFVTISYLYTLMHICWTKWHCDRLSLQYFQFYPLSIIPTKLHTQLHLHVAVTRRTNGRSLGTLKKVNFFRKWGGMGYKNRHTFNFSVLKGLKAGGPFIFTIQNVSCHRPPTPLGYFVLSRDNSNLHCQIISDYHN